MKKDKSTLIFIGISTLIILAIVILVLNQLHSNYCLGQKEKFIKGNLPTEYGPQTSIEKRMEDTKKINDVYYGCLYPWK